MLQTFINGSRYMRNFFKKVLFSGALLAAGAAMAGNQLDGVYLCSTNIPGVGSMTSYTAVLTNAQGVTGWAVMNAAPNTQAYGYGLGTASASSFTGADMNGKPFAFSVTGTTYTGSHFVAVNGASIASTSTCAKVW
jgi:hypothetical protein